MTREQITHWQLNVLAAEFAHRNDETALRIAKTIALARRALELEEALEWVATNCVGLWRGESGSVWAEMGHGSYDGVTALEAIQNARRGK